MSNTAILFPGQGAQERGMGREAAEADNFSMELWKKAERISGRPLREIYWEGDEAAMADTASLQPALTVVCLTLWGKLSGRVKPKAAAGHSLGEYSALAAAGVLSLDDTLNMVTLRGRLMAEADPGHLGSMSAVLKINREDTESIVREVAESSGEIIVAANYNTPSQLIISGTAKALEIAAAKVKEKKGRVLPLRVSGAFHSPLVAEANKELSLALKKAVWGKPRFAVYSNVRGMAIFDGESLREAMLEQMASPVRWTELIRAQWQDGIRKWLEIGPKEVLSKMVKPNLEGFAPVSGEELDKSISTENISDLSQVEVFS